MFEKVVVKMVNFLRETIESIGETNHSEQDVMFVGSADGEYRVSWDKFKEISNFEYDNGYGGQEVAYDLIVYFKDGSWLERYEYDGSERWCFVGLKNFREDDDYKGFIDIEKVLKDEYNYTFNEEDLEKTDALEISNEYPKINQLVMVNIFI